MLPHFVAGDFADVIGDLNDRRLRVRGRLVRAASSSFASRVSARSRYRGVHLELRHALEPWHVLGEEAAGGGTARYVDSSLERLQVKVDGLIDGRHVIAVQRPRACRCIRPGPAASTWPASAIAPGSRPTRCTRPFRCTRRSSSTWSTRGPVDRSAAARTTCPIRAAAAHDTRPVNAYEAEGRRLARFLATGHTPGPIELVRTPPAAGSSVHAGPAPIVMTRSGPVMKRVTFTVH